MSFNLLLLQLPHVNPLTCFAVNITICSADKTGRIVIGFAWSDTMVQVGGGALSKYVVCKIVNLLQLICPLCLYFGTALSV